MKALAERKEELRKALQDDAPWGTLINFLDTINSVEELEGLSLILNMAGKNDLVQFYRKNLNRWPDPKLPKGFTEKCPLLAARLDTPQKVRVLLRGADFRSVEPLLMGEVFEEIIRRHEVEGHKIVSFRDDRIGKRGDAIRIVYHTQLQAWTLTRLILGRQGGMSSDIGTYVDWRTKEEMIADGEPEWRYSHM